MSAQNPAAETASAQRPLALRDPELERVRQLGRWLQLAESGAKTEAAVGAANALRYWYAKELGLTAMAAGEVSLIEGKLVVSAMLLRALAERQGYRVVPVDASDTACTAVVYRDGKELGRSTFTIDDAKRAGLAGRTNYRNYPGRMMWARAATWAIRDWAAVVAAGIVTAEELDEFEQVKPAKASGLPPGGVIADESPLEDADWDDVQAVLDEEQARAEIDDDIREIPFGGPDDEESARGGADGGGD